LFCNKFSIEICYLKLNKLIPLPIWKGSMKKYFLSFLALGSVLATSAQAEDRTVGANFADINLPAGQTVTIVAPTSNTKGVYIRTFDIIAGPNAQTMLTIGQTAPVPNNAGQVVYLIDGWNQGASYNAPTSIYIPPNTGIYGMSQTAEGFMHLSWDLVQ
jgi:hypothetical protein